MQRQTVDMSNEVLNGEALVLSEQEMRALGYRAVDMVVDHLTQLADHRVSRGSSRAELEPRPGAKAP